MGVTPNLTETLKLTDFFIADRPMDSSILATRPVQQTENPVEAAFRYPARQGEDSLRRADEKGPSSEQPNAFRRS